MFTGCYALEGIPSEESVISLNSAGIPSFSTDTTNCIIENQQQQQQQQQLQVEGEGVQQNVATKNDDNKSESTSSGPSKRSRSGGRTRVAAHEFRQKQKLYIYSLEKRVAELTAVNAEMQSRLHLMSNENNIIKEHLAYLRGFIAQAVPPLNMPEQDPSLTPYSSSSSSSSSSSVETEVDTSASMMMTTAETMHK